MLKNISKNEKHYIYKTDFSHCFFLLIVFKFYMQKFYFEYWFPSHQIHKSNSALHTTFQQQHCNYTCTVLFWAVVLMLHKSLYNKEKWVGFFFFFFPSPPNKWILEANTEWIDFQLILDNLSILKILPTDKSNKQLSTLRKQFLFTFDISGQRYNTIKCTKH